MNDGLAIAPRFADFRCLFLVSSPFLRVFIRSLCICGDTELGPSANTYGVSTYPSLVNHTDKYPE